MFVKGFVIRPCRFAGGRQSRLVAAAMLQAALQEKRDWAHHLETGQRQLRKTVEQKTQISCLHPRERERGRERERESYLLLILVDNVPCPLTGCVQSPMLSMSLIKAM